jgi:TetR/AcrR family transcriptional regulator, transcriptional repressor for nem operon
VTPTQPSSRTTAHGALASATSKSQLYQHFGDKEAIVAAALEAQVVGLLADQQRALASVRALTRPRS